MMIEFYRQHLIYEYNFTYSPFWTNQDRKFLLLEPFRDFHFNSPHPKSSKNISSWLMKDRSDQDFCKVI